MRLDKIKLAGFKSFVDPTTVLFPSNLVAVVGPNGCGKSNVIDAVRWVMGESSAKMLRGESMADVIFNGSSSRKPVGSAVIELVFDNSDGSAGGQYAQYNHISVKRQVSRDGQSGYFLNGTRCRRRDITDLFLGTGLGPRSYSIIEQGTISRLIEARPEELRHFLEEAAGISKYKERRRETETRIRHTRENLDRLNDLREEVSKHLQRLERQAATAERYKALREEERQHKAQLLALRWRALDADLGGRERCIGELETGVEAAVARQRHIEAELEQNREEQHQASDHFNTVQGRFYATGADIARLEQSLQFSRDAKRRQEQELAQVKADWHRLGEQLSDDERRRDALRADLREQEPALERALAEEAARTLALDEAEDAMQLWQSAWDAFHHSAAEPAQIAQVERTRINHLEQQADNLERRLRKLDEEFERLDSPLLEQELQHLAAAEQRLLEQVAAQRECLQAAQAGIEQARAEQNQLTVELNGVQNQLQTARGRRASLDALQQAALTDGGQALRAWLEARGLASAPRLAEHLQVEPRWQRAAELVLGHALQALCTDALPDHARALDSLPEGSLHLYQTGGAAHPTAPPDSLLARVQAPWPLASLLHGVGLADSLEQALSRRAALAPGQSLVTPDGIWLGPDWLRAHAGEQPASGVLERVEELKTLTARIVGDEQLVDRLMQRLQTRRQDLDGAEAARAQAQDGLDQCHRELAQVRTELSAKRTRAEHLQQRRVAVAAEQAETREHIVEDREDMAEARQRLHAALAQMESLAEQRAALVEQRERLKSALEQARGSVKSLTDKTHKLALEVEAARTASASLDNGLERLRMQSAQFEQRLEMLQDALLADEQPLAQLQASLDHQLMQRVRVEAALADARDRLESVDALLREGEQQRLRAEQEAQRRRAELDQARLQRQEVLIRCKTLEEQLKETGFARAHLLQALPEDAKEADWQAELARLAERIQRLGAINLAAIDEFKEESERKQYLDAQFDDINRSLTTLEDAIRKIDRETRNRFKDTFEKVNHGLQTLFPRLFGGGHAYLELTGEDLLDTGVAVMARPPGKRNSSIYLLSGGEKALTAVAMVFSIFQLNPAPFCMLDEVDAPLDDANVSRFCDLVKSMSEQVQFIFITHNKVTMEMANQLSGVTMHEPGVSRLVSVDVDEAVQLAAV
jgi:chromosome segregation protein